MKTKFFGKAISILLAICMFVSLFTCLTALPVSASASDTKMLHAQATAAGLKFGWRTASGGDPLVKGTKYRLSLDWENVSNAPFGSTMFSIYCYSGGWRNLYSNSTYCSEWTVSSYALTHGNHYDIDFTVKSSLSECREFVLYFGDIGNKISSYEFNTANWVLYTRDSSNNLTDTGKTFTFPVTFRGASDGAMNSYISTYTGSERGKLWSNNTSSSYARSFVDIPSGYFDVPPDEYVHFEPDRNNYSRWRYKTDYVTFPAGNYRFTLDCKIFSGTPVINVGSADYGGNTFSPTEKFKNYTATYDSVNYKYTITFTFDEAFGGSDAVGVLIGNYGTDGNFVCAHPELYRLDGSGDPVGNNFVKPFNSANYTTASARDLWIKAGNSTSTVLPDNYFDKESTSNYALHFPQVSDSYQVVVYKDNGIYIPGNSTYRLVMDVNNLTEAEPTIEMRTGTSIGNAYTGTLISTDGYERVYEFTVTESATGMGLFMGPYSNGSNIDVAFRKPRLYKWVNGAYGGANMLAPLSANNFDRHEWAGTRENALNGKWTPLNCNGTLLEYDVDNGSNFVPVVDQMVHFPIGYDNSQVLVYKGGAIAAGTYRFTVDEYAVTGVTSYVNLWVNADYKTPVTKGTDTLVGNKRTVEFTLYNPKDSFLLMIGNFSMGDNMDTYYANAKFYKVEGGSTVGNNLISNFKSNNVVFTKSGTRVNAATNKWTTLNWAKGLIIFDEYHPGQRMLKLGGYGDSMNALSYETALTPGETYQFDMDYRANGGVSARKAVSAAVSGTEKESLTDSNTLLRTDTGTHYSVMFTISSSATWGVNNFNIYLGQSWPQKRNGTVYFANLTLRKVTGGVLGKANYFYNGDFHRGDTGVVTNSTKNTVFDGWNQMKVMTHTRVEIMDVPENFFVDNQNMNCDKVYEFKGGDLYKPQFNFQFLSNRKYRLIYDYFCDNDDTVNAYIISKDNSVTAEKTSRVSEDGFEAVYDITVGANADPYNDSYAPNGNIRFALNGNSYDKAFCIGNIRMYYLDEDDNITGANLVYNLNPILQDGYYGLHEVGDSSTFTLSKDDSNVESQKRNVGISWVGNLNYTNENVGCYSRIVKTNGHKFDYYSNAQSISFARKAILETGTGYNPVGDTGSRFYDPNKDGTLNVRDLVRYKNNAKNGVNSFAVANEQTNGGIYDSFNKVVCYGDSITQGMGYSASQAYPGRLQSMIGSGYTVVNSGDAGESSNTIMSRQGVYTLKTANSMTFPAGTATITIGNQDNNGFVSTNGDYIGLTSALGNENKLNNITIGGNQYTISLSDFVWSPRSYTVKLTRVGSTSSAITIPAGTKTVFRGTTQQDTCEIYLVGANDSDKSSDKLVAKYKAMVDNHGSNNFLIIIPYFGGVSRTPFLNAFGDHCVDFKTIASTDEAFEYEGLTKTADDENMISQSRLPLSFRRIADENEVHLNDKGYDLLAHHLYLQGQALSYFDSPALRKVNQTYRYEIHMHDKEVSACGQSLGSKYITKAKSMGFAGFIITNHFYRGNTAIDRNLSWSDFIDAYKEDYEKLKAEAAAQDMDVLFGVEDDYDNSHHCLIYGISPDLWKTVPNYPSMTFPQVYDFVHSNGGIIVYAHPYRDTSDANLSGYPDMRYADAIEVYNASRSDESNQLALKYAKAHNLIMTAGSDAHNFNSFGQGAMEFTHRLYTIENFIEEVLAENYTIIRNK